MTARGDSGDFDVIAIIGVGLIGGSLGMAARQRGLVGRVIGVGRNERRLSRAVELGAIDESTLDTERGAARADLVVVCTPVRLVVPTIERIAPHLKPAVVVTDVGSVKGEIVSGAQAVLADGASFVGGHPMAGSEESGVEAARADLFEGATYVITTTDNTDPSALGRLMSFAQSLGANPLIMTPEEHDRAVALISHLPHVLAAAALQVASEAERDAPGHVFSLAAGSFRDLTRVAASHPVLWRDICLSNRAAIVDALRGFEQRLAALREVIESGSEAELESVFEEAKRLRDLLMRVKV